VIPITSLGRWARHSPSGRASVQLTAEPGRRPRDKRCAQAIERQGGL